MNIRGSMPLYPPLLSPSFVLAQQAALGLAGFLLAPLPSANQLLLEYIGAAACCRFTVECGVLGQSFSCTPFYHRSHPPLSLLFFPFSRSIIYTSLRVLSRFLCYFFRSSASPHILCAFFFGVYRSFDVGLSFLIVVLLIEPPK